MYGKLKVLNVAEKPSVAREVSRLLANGSPSRKKSHSEFNPVFLFDFQLLSNRCDMYFTSVAGHLMKTDFSSQYKDWNAVKPETLYTAEIHQEVDQNCAKIARNLTEYAQLCQWLVLWLDCDREGEAIAFEVVKVCTEVNRNLKVLRATFSSVTAGDIFRACGSLQPPNQALADAVDARIEMDLRIGASFTRLLSTRYTRRFALPTKLISFGPCQFPTLGFLVERHMEIDRFVREPFWALHVSLPSSEHVTAQAQKRLELTWNRNRLFDKLASLIYLESCLKSPEAVVKNVTGKEKRKYKPLPLNTVEMNKAASRLLSMSSHRCMQVAENLYNRGFISYPRTETEVFDKAIDIKGFISAQQNSGAWGNYATSLLNGKFHAPRAGKGNDKAHPPIHPVKPYSREEGGNECEWKLYEFITRHFLACCSDDAVGFESRVDIDIATESFHTTGLTIMERNWLDVYPYESWNAKELRHFRKNERISVSSISLKEGKTEPPPLLAESDLLEKMNQNGIGTDATMHEHIQTIQDRQYAIKDERFNVIPTVLGVALVMGFKSIADKTGIDLSKPALRSQMEADMAAIADGVKSKDDVVAAHVAKISSVFHVVKHNLETLDREIANHFKTTETAAMENTKVINARFSKCGKCGNEMDIKINDIADNAGNGNRSNVNNKKTNGKAGKTNQRTKDSTPIEKRYLVCRGRGCSTILLLPSNGVFTPNQNNCAYCNFQALNVYNPRTNKNHNICPYCFRNPPAQETGASSTGQNDDSFSEFRCFRCHHSTCPLAFNRNK